MSFISNTIGDIQCTLEDAEFEKVNNIIDEQNNNEKDDILNNTLLREQLEDTFEESFIEHRLSFVSRDDCKHLKKLWCAVRVRVPDILKVKVIGKANDLFNSNVEFAFRKFSIKCVSFTGVIVSVYRRENFTIYQVEDDDEEVMCIHWTNNRKKMEIYEKVKELYKNTIFHHLIPKDIDTKFELKDLVRIEGFLCIYQQNMQVKIMRAAKISSKYRLINKKYVNDLYKDVYDVVVDAPVKEVKMKYAPKQLLRLLQEQFITIIPDVKSIVDYVINMENREDSLSADELKINVEYCIERLLNIGLIIKYSPFINKYMITEGNSDLYKELIHHIKGYRGVNGGIPFNNLLTLITNNRKYQCFTYIGFKSYIYNCLERSDFIEIEDNCYMYV